MVLTLERPSLLVGRTRSNTCILVVKSRSPLRTVGLFQMLIGATVTQTLSQAVEKLFAGAAFKGKPIAGIIMSGTHELVRMS